MFTTLVVFALKSTTILSAAWLAAFLLRGRSAATRYTIWTAAALALLSLPILSVLLPALPVNATTSLLPDFIIAMQSTDAAHTANAPLAAPSQRAMAPLPTARSGPDWRVWLMWIWAAGAAAAFARMLDAYAKLWRLRCSAKPSPNPLLSAPLARLLGIRREVEVLEAPAGTMPMAFGITRPAVLLPRGASDWSDERRRVVLLHELAHIRRGDMAGHLLARMALILNWWNPLAWMAWRALLNESERAADDLVLLAGAPAAEYASHLLEVARGMQTTRASWAAVAMARQSQLEGRLRAILDPRIVRRGPLRGQTLALAVVAAGLVAPLAALRAQENAPANITPDVDSTIRAAMAQKNYEMLDKPASLLEELGEYDSAKKLLDAAATIREDVSGKQSVDYGDGLMKLGELESKRGRRQEAEGYYSRALLAIGERPPAAPVLIRLGAAAVLDEHFSKANEYFQRALRIDTVHSGTALMWLAVVAAKEKSPSEAEAMFKRALAAQHAESSEAALTMRVYARFLHDQGRTDEGNELENRAAALQKTQLEKPRSNASGTVYRIGGPVSSPKVLKQVDPEYTDEARAAGLSGTVVIHVEIGTDGRARNIQILRGLGLGLDENAVATMQRWSFQPSAKDGHPVTVSATIEMNWQLK